MLTARVAANSFDLLVRYKVQNSTMNCYKTAKDALLEQSRVNMAGLLNKTEDYSLEKEAVVHHLSEDKTSQELRKNAYKWCRRCLRGSWAKISENQFRIEHIRYC